MMFSRKTAIVWCFLFLTAAPCQAQTQAQTVLAPGHPESHVVRKGDTLWDIASRFLAQPWRWPELWRINPQIEDPHLIYPGDIIRLVYREGEPVLTLERAGGGQPPGGQQAGQQPGQQPGQQAGQQPGQQAGSRQDRFVKLSPQARIYPREQSITTIPLHEIQHYLTDVRVVPGRESDEWPYVLSTVIDSTAHRVYAAAGKVYVRGKLDPAQVTYSVYRERRLYRDPELPERILGQELIYVGDVEIVRFGDPSIGFIKSFKSPLRQGDRLYVEEEGEGESLVSFFPRPPSQEISGQIIDVFGGIVVAAERQVVVLDVGSNAGLERGNVLAIQQQQIRFEDPLSAELKAKQQQAERIRFQYEDVSATDNLLSSIFNDVRGLANTFNRSGLVRYIGGPTQHPEQVELEGQKNGYLLVFRTFPEVSYGLIMDIDFPVYLNDLVTNP